MHRFHADMLGMALFLHAGIGFGDVRYALFVDGTGGQRHRFIGKIYAATGFDHAVEIQIKRPRCCQGMKFARRGGKIYKRDEMKTKTVVGSGDQKQEMEGTTLSVCDGEFVWVYSENMGQKSAMKQKIDPKQIEPTAMFGEMKKDHDVKLLDSQKVEVSGWLDSSHDGPHSSIRIHNHRAALDARCIPGHER